MTAKEAQQWLDRNPILANTPGNKTASRCRTILKKQILDDAKTALDEVSKERDDLYLALGSAHKLLLQLERDGWLPNTGPVHDKLIKRIKANRKVLYK